MSLAGNGVGVGGVRHYLRITIMADRRKSGIGKTCCTVARIFSPRVVTNSLVNATALVKETTRRRAIIRFSVSDCLIWLTSSRGIAEPLGRTGS